MIFAFPSFFQTLEVFFSSILDLNFLFPWSVRYLPDWELYMLEILFVMNTYSLKFCYFQFGSFLLTVSAFRPSPFLWKICGSTETLSVQWPHWAAMHVSNIHYPYSSPFWSLQTMFGLVEVCLEEPISHPTSSHWELLVGIEGSIITFPPILSTFSSQTLVSIFFFEQDRNSQNFSQPGSTQLLWVSKVT